MLRAIEWNGLIIPGGISHGYTFEGAMIPYAWDVFGGESWLVELAYAGVTGQVAPIAYPSPQTANGSGFIDELAWLFVPPPSGQDYWGTDWTAYRATASDLQTSYYPTHYSTSCFTQLGLFGLSASEVPDPARVSKESIYQAFGVGGHFTQANDGASLFGAPVVVPHYSAMIASLHPQETIKVWDRLIESGYLTPINNVESIMFPADSNCAPESVVWNDLKGSWNLALQTLGWGRYLAERDGYVPILWQAKSENSLVRKGYIALALHGPLGTPTPIRNDTPAPSPSTLTPWTLSRECENPDEMTVGQLMERSAALGSKVHGQFGTMVDPLWPARSGYVKYRSLYIPQRERLYLRLRYSKYSPPGTPILISIDDELSPRAKFYPVDQGDWNNFAWSESISLGSITQGTHSLKFYTDGQQYGVADLDLFILTGESPAVALPEISEKSAMVPITQTIPVHWVPMKTPLSIEATVFVRVTETVLEWVTATPSPQP
jgi:hypothetical protein